MGAARRARGHVPRPCVDPCGTLPDPPAPFRRRELTLVARAERAVVELGDVVRAVRAVVDGRGEGGGGRGLVGGEAFARAVGRVPLL